MLADSWLWPNDPKKYYQMKTQFNTLVLSLLLWGCATKPSGTFQSASTPIAPDYSQTSSWAALPTQEDPADLTPDGLRDRQATATADVFFLHPTTYTGKPGDNLWNSPTGNTDLQKRILEGPIQFQASAFNAAGKVYAPHYRQAHLEAYFTKDTTSARQAFDLAYNDVRRAFEYYLEHYQKDRPIIIAAHSQGTTHAKRLLKEFFDGHPLQKRLVAAYLIGIPVRNTDFSHLQPCTDSLDTGCYVSWRTFRRGTKKEPEPAVIVTNPLLWDTTKAFAPRTLNEGAVLRPFEKVRPNNVSAEVRGPVLWSSKPQFPGSFLMLRRNYHVGDLNLFYVNIRNNAVQRVEAFTPPKHP